MDKIKAKQKAISMKNSVRVGKLQATKSYVMQYKYSDMVKEEWYTAGRVGLAAGLLGSGGVVVSLLTEELGKYQYRRFKMDNSSQFELTDNQKAKRSAIARKAGIYWNSRDFLAKTERYDIPDDKLNDEYDEYLNNRKKYMKKDLSKKYKDADY